MSSGLRYHATGRSWLASEQAYEGVLRRHAKHFLVALEALFAGPISGASMNPARSLGPALVSGHLQHLWVYLTAPVAGACLAVFFCAFMCEPDCCEPREVVSEIRQ